MVYSNAAGEDQAPINILEIAEELPASPPEQVAAFRTRYLSKREQDQLKWAVITLWQRGELSSHDALRQLFDCGFVRAEDIADQEINAFLRLYVASEKALANGRVA